MFFRCTDPRPNVASFLSLGRKRARGLGAGMVDGIQPSLRFIYVKYMGGVDLADQYLMSHFHQHRPQTYFLRRVFDQKFAQATSNAYLLFVKWATDVLDECKLEIKELATAMEAGPAAVAARAEAKAAERASVAAAASTAAGPGADVRLSLIHISEPTRPY